MGGVRANLHKCPVFKNNFISGDRLRWLVRWVHLVDNHSLPSRPLHWSLYFHLPCQQVGRRRIIFNIQNPIYGKPNYQIQTEGIASLQLQGVMFIVETSKSCFSFSVEQGQRPQSLALPTKVTMI